MRLLDDLHALVSLMRENNLLLRELISNQTGNRSKVPRADQPPIRQFTDKDVKVITKEMRERMAIEAEQNQAPWRTPDGGPDSGTTSPLDGSKSNGADGS